MRKTIKLTLASLFVVSAFMPAIAASPASTELSRKAKSGTLAHKAKPLSLMHKTQKVGAKSSRVNQFAKTFSFSKCNSLFNVKQKSPRSAETVPVNLRGTLVYSDDLDYPVGMYYLPQDGSPIELIAEGVNSLNGGAEVDGIYYAANSENFFGYIYGNLDAYNSTSWESLYPIGTVEIPESMLATATAKDPTDGTVYGCFFKGESEGYEYGIIDYKLQERTTISTLSVPWMALGIDGAGKMYAIDFYGVLNSVDKTTGTVTQIGSTGIFPQYVAGGTIDPASGRFFWSVATDFEGALYEVDMTTAEATKLYDFPGAAQVTGLYVASPLAAATAPGHASDLSASFKDGELTGIVSFTAPSTLFNGDSAKGEISYKVYANDVVVATGKTHYGELVTAEVLVTESGYYKFAVATSNDSGDSPLSSISQYVGTDMPSMTAVTLICKEGNMDLTWSPVTGSVHGGFIVPEDVTYTVVRFPGDIVVAENIKETTFRESVPEPEDLTVYYYEVTASFNGVKSEISTSNAVVLGSVEPPFSETFDSDGAKDIFTIIDSNKDGYSWEINNGEVYYIYSSDNDGDDWLITPGIRLRKGKKYEFSVDFRCEGYPERVEVKYGNTPTVEGLDRMLIAPMDVLDSTPTTEIAYIVPEEDGVYYIGLHAISDADCFTLHVDNLQLSAGTSFLAPGAITDTKIVPDFDGELKASIEFTAPSTAIDGSSLKDISKIEIISNDVVVTTVDNPAPGSVCNTEVEVEETSLYTFRIVAYNEEGEGESAYASMWIGIPIPSAPTDIIVTENDIPGNVTISWKAPETDSFGNPLNLRFVSYVIVNGVGEVLADNIKDTTCTFQAVPEGEQDFVQFAVYAVTESGQDASGTEQYCLGTPYALPFFESVSDGFLSYPVATGESEYMGQWVLAADGSLGISSYDQDGGFLLFQGDYVGSTCAIWTGLIDLGDSENPALSLAIYNLENLEGGESNTNIFEVMVKASDSDKWESLDAMYIEDLEYPGWNKVIHSLSEYKGKVISLKFIATTQIYTYTMIDAIKVSDLKEYNLSSSGIVAPEVVKPDTEFNVSIKVENNGAKDAEDFSVILYRNGKAVDRKESLSLASGFTEIVRFSQVLNVTSETETEYYAEIEYARDQTPSDNKTAITIVGLDLPLYPIVEDLVAKYSGKDVELSWSAPNTENGAPQLVTESFEECESWSQEYGEWKFVDLDNAPIGGFQNVAIPGLTAGASTASYFVFDVNDGQFNQTYSAHSGSKYLAAVYRADDGQTDDWAISPELYGGKQTVKFYAKSYNNTYPEKIEVLYSTTSHETECFVPATDEIVLTGDDWTEITANLPDGAKYFAIRSFAVGSFMLMIDDVSFIPKSVVADLEILGYNVYRNGNKINNPIVDTNFYIDSDMEKSAEYVVTVVYNLGESAPSNIANVVTGINDIEANKIMIYSVGGDIIIESEKSVDMAIFSSDGKVIHNSKSSSYVKLHVEKGVYVVKVGNKVRKLTVR